MKSVLWFSCIAAILLSLGCVSQKDWHETREADTRKSIFDYSSYWIDNDFSIQVTILGDKVVVEIVDPKILPIDHSDRKYLNAAKVKLHSGILAANRMDNTVFKEAVVQNGRLVFEITNYAKQKGVPVVEHLWGEGYAEDGTFGTLALDPQNKWIIYDVGDDGKIDLDSLAIGIVMYPDRPTIPLKALKQGKLVPGRHRELYSQYVSQKPDENIIPHKYTIKRVVGRAVKRDTFKLDACRAEIDGLAQAAAQVSKIPIHSNYLPGQIAGIQTIINDKIARSGWLIVKYRVLNQPQHYTKREGQEVVEVPLEVIFSNKRE